MRTGNSRTQQRLLRRRAVRHAVRRLTPSRRRPDGDGTGDEKHARGARTHLSRDAQPKMGRCGRRLCANGGCFAGSYAVVGGVSEVVPVDLHIPGCRQLPRPCCKDCWRCWNVRTLAPLRREKRYRTRSSILFGWRTILLFGLGFVTCSRSRTPRPPATLAAPGLISSIPASRARNQLHQRIDIAADHAVAGFHALDGRHRKVGQFGHLPLIDVQERARGPKLIGGDHGAFLQFGAI